MKHKRKHREIPFRDYLKKFFPVGVLMVFLLLSVLFFRVVNFNGYQFSESLKKDLERNLISENIYFSEYYAFPSHFFLTSLSSLGEENAPLKRILLANLKGDLKVLPFLFKGDLEGEILDIKSAELLFSPNLTSESFLQIFSHLSQALPSYQLYQIKNFFFSLPPFFDIKDASLFIKVSEKKDSIQITARNGKLKSRLFSREKLLLKNFALTLSPKEKRFQYHISLFSPQNNNLEITLSSVKTSLPLGNTLVSDFMIQHLPFRSFSQSLNALFKGGEIDGKGKVFFSPSDSNASYQLDFSARNLNLKKFPFFIYLTDFFFLNMNSGNYEMTGKMTVSDKEIKIVDFLLPLDASSKLKGNLSITKEGKISGIFSLGIEQTFLEKRKSFSERFSQTKKGNLYWLKFKVFGTIQNPKDTFHHLFSKEDERRI